MPTELSSSVIIFLGSLIYATFGFGDAMFAMPFLSIILGIKTATPLMTLNGFTLALILFIKHRTSINWKITFRLIIASAFGIPIGIYFLKNGNEYVAKIILGSIITSVAIYNLFIRKNNSENKLPANAIYIFGFIAGVLGGAFNTGGPAIVVFGTLNGWTPMQFMSTLQGYFLPSDTIILIGQLSAGLLTKNVFHYYLVGLPFLLVGLLIGSKLRKKIPEGKFTKLIFWLLLCIGIMFILRAVLLFQA